MRAQPSTLPSFSSRDPIKKSHAYYVGGQNYDGKPRAYYIWRDGHFLKIWTDIRESIDYESDHPINHATDYSHILGIIQTMIAQIKWEEVDGQSAYLFRSRDGYRVQLQPATPLPIHIVCAAPFIPEEEIESICWQNSAFRKGIYKDQAVEMVVPWDEQWVDMVQYTSAGYQMMHDRKLERFIFPLVGYMVDHDGRTVRGIITTSPSPAWRPVTAADKSAVFKAVTVLQKAGLVHLGLGMDSIYLDEDSNVRFLNLSSLDEEPDEDECATKAAHWHWEKLKLLFDVLSKPIALHDRLLNMRDVGSSELMLPPPISPSHVIMTDCDLDFGLLQFAFELFVQDIFDHAEWRASLLNTDQDQKPAATKKKMNEKLQYHNELRTDRTSDLMLALRRPRTRNRRTAFYTRPLTHELVRILPRDSVQLGNFAYISDVDDSEVTLFSGGSVYSDDTDSTLC